ncbi:MAG: Wadjet anti-phage system protein JetD domain-containing protein [Planctomycetaceae bacterium]
MSKRSLLQPDGIKDKALRQYPGFLSAWLSGTPFFPLHIPGIGAPDESLAIAQQQVQSLKNGSKEVVGYGYVIEWQERNSRHHGRNLFPDRVVFESQPDFLRLIGKQREFAEFASAVERIRSQLPELESWLLANRALLLRHLNVVDGLLDVVAYFRQHPRPNVFAREIPLTVDTKFIEQNSGILEQWLDRVLPPETIRADERHFERRFGLRYAEPLLLLRFLDPALQRSVGSPWPECSVWLHALADSPIEATTVFIVENKVNLLTFPTVPSAIAMGGLGNGIIDLTYVKWLSNRSLWYWGDLDVEGFEILSRLRIRFPQTRSFLMDDTTLLRWKDSLAISGTDRRRDVPALLTEPETTAFSFCNTHNMRIEQERIPQAAVAEAVSELILVTATFGVR